MTTKAIATFCCRSFTTTSSPFPPKTHIFFAKQLKSIVSLILIRSGSSTDEAEIVADHLVQSNLCGHDSHGVGMLPTYIRHIKEKTLIPNVPFTVTKNVGPIIQVDGKRGFGQRLVREAMLLAIQRSKEIGVAAITVRGVHHLGRVGTYGELAVAAGLFSIHFANVIDHHPLVAPYGGSDARMGTNPICIAVPGTKTTPATILDMATSRLALGKTRVAVDECRNVSSDCLFDACGLPTTDPGVMWRKPEGALLPTGDYKGSGLGFMTELLSGLLSGGGTVQDGNERKGGIVNNLFSIVIDPLQFADNIWLQNEMDAITSFVKSSPEAKVPPSDPSDPSGKYTGKIVRVAGDKEREKTASNNLKGISINDNTWHQIVSAGESLGISKQELESMAFSSK